ncbi:hypothetical protein [Sphaerochaeta sp.]|uniref:hypothetical protein n=1 Tax=Sphaerochaeta sp. TaxID=1972642 RepID=UPI002FC7EADD
MKKVEKRLSSIVFVCALLLSLGSVLYAQDDALLLALQIEQADQQQLVQMVQLRNLAVGETEEMRASLRAYHQITQAKVEAVKNGSNRYHLEIVHADSMQTNAASSLVRLEGNVEVTFLQEGSKEGTKLRAQRMLVDVDRTLLSAQGEVTYVDSRNQANLQTMEGSIVTLDWSDSLVLFSETATLQEQKNSENQKISLYTFGSLITSRGQDGGLSYEQGWIGTRKEDPLSSLRASKLYVLPGGDLLLHNASLSLGRVPVFWTPFFLIPGNRMVGNPAMGFVSDRGMFVSTTYELFGSYPYLKQSKQSSFTSLLSFSDSAAVYPDGPIYATKGKPSDFDEWAQKSESYLALLADAYENDGVMLGLDGYGNLWDKKLTLKSLGSVALYPEGKEALFLYGDVPKLRYYSENQFVVDTKSVNLKISIPLYSDPKVKRLYANRLTSFSFDALFGKKQEFPTTFLSDVASYTWNIDGSFSMPLSRLEPWVSTLTISNLKAVATWNWKDIDSTYAYQLDSLTLPELSAHLKGSIFSLSTELEKQKKQDAPAKEVSFNGDALLPPPYSMDSTSSKDGATPPERKLSLGYSIDQTLTQTFEAPQGQIDWNKDRYFYSLTKASLRLDASPNTKLLALSEELLPQYSIVEDQSKTAYLSQQMQLFSLTKASVPILGVTYTLSQRLYRFQRTFSTAEPLPSEEETTYAFNRDSVTVHQLAWEYGIPLALGNLKPSLTANLYPVKQSVISALQYVYQPYTLSGSLRWVDENGRLVGDMVQGKQQISTSLFNASATQTYDLRENSGTWFHALSLSESAKLSFLQKTITIGQTFSYAGLNSDGLEHAVDDLTFTLQVPYFQVSYSSNGSIGNLDPLSMKIQISAKELNWRFSKRRVALSLGLDTTFTFHFQDRYASNFSFKANVGLQIAEFMDVFFSVTSTNTGFFKYYDGTDRFRFDYLWEDLLRSFDFSGTGRYNTQFNLTSLSLEFVHYLSDWSLNCKYQGSVVLSNNQYSWVPTVSVFLQWNALPELNVEESWTQTDSQWVRSQLS